MGRISGIVTALLLTAIAGGQTRSAFDRGREAYRRKQNERAVELLSRVPESDPDFPRAMTMIGYSLWGRRLRQPEKGLPFLDRAFAAAPGDPTIVESCLNGYALAGRAFGRASVERERAEKTPPELAALVAPTPPSGRWAAQIMKRADLLTDLDYLEVLLVERYSYLETRAVGYRAALDAIRASIGETMPRATFARRLAALLARFGDGHSMLDAKPSRYRRVGFAPFLPIAVGGGVIAVRPDRSGFLDEERPFVVAVDGLPIHEWLAAGDRFSVASTPLARRSDAARELRNIEDLRAELGRATAETIALGLAKTPGGAGGRPIELSVADRRPSFGTWPRRESGTLEGNLGYLRLASMRADPERENLDAAMRGFRETKGLIIDVRGNRGGTRRTLMTLLPYFLEGTGAEVIGVAALRRDEGPGYPREGILASRFLRPISSTWPRSWRRGLRRFAASFRPERELPPGKFTEWHVTAVDRAYNPLAYPYAKPVVILQDERSTSATDVFLGALGGRGGVTLLGATSGGGSGRAIAFFLPRSQLQIRLCTMVSFRPDGRELVGRGVAPDVEIPAEPGFFVGRSDRVLDEARRRLAGR